MTRARPEKRQRILISAKYDETLESVEGRLQQLQETVNALYRDVRHAPASLKSGARQDFGLDTTFSNGWVPGLPAASLGYRGDPSFEAQAGRITSAFGTSPVHPPLEGSANTVVFSHASQCPDPCSGYDVASSQTETGPLHEQQPGPRRHPLPPIEPVLKLLRLVQTEKQRLFVDVFVLDEQEFTVLCREVFFAVTPYTLYAWSIVNVGLFYLFTDLEAVRFANIGIDSNEVGGIIELLAANAQDAVDAFRVCSEPSIEACQALAFLVSPHGREIHICALAKRNRAHSASNPGKSRGPGP